MAEILERTYTIPLKRETNKTVPYKKAKKAISAIQLFLARHMKVENRDIKKIKLSEDINRAIWSRGIKHPPQKITVKATKDKEGIVKVEFLGLPKKFKSEETQIKKEMEKKKKKAAEKAKKAEAKPGKVEKKEKKEEAEKEVKEEKKPEKKVKKI